MKKIKLILALFLFSHFLLLHNETSAQWTQQVSNVYNVLNSVHCVNDTVCYTVGDYGERLKTTDGGLYWENIKWFGDNDLKSTFVKKDTVAFAFGLFLGVTGILPGMEIWGGPYNLPFSTDNLMGRCIYYINDNLGFAVGDSGVIIKSDTGLVNTDNWFLQTSGTTQNLYSVHFVSDSTGYAVGDSGIILSTINGGNNWIQKNSGTLTNFKSVFSINDSIAFVVGNNGTILSTLDGGDNWISVPSNTNYNLNSVCFPSDSIGYIAGNNGIIMKTVDTGNTWVIQQTGVFNNLKSIYFTDNNNGYAVGSSGKILSTTNGGEITVNLNQANDNSSYQMVFYPNPFTDITVMNIPEPLTDNFTLVLFDVFGREMKRIENIKNKNLIVKRDNLHLGLYICILYERDKVISTGKLIVVSSNR